CRRPLGGKGQGHAQCNRQYEGSFHGRTITQKAASLPVSVNAQQLQVWNCVVMMRMNRLVASHPARQPRFWQKQAACFHAQKPPASYGLHRPAEVVAEANGAACSPRLMGATFSAAACA